MPIPSTKYVNITSAVGGNTSLSVTNLITRCFTSNPLVPTGGVPLTFNSASAVGIYFGTSSVEYLRAVFYFGWISKNFSFPQSISYAHWASAATYPLIFGAQLGNIGTTLSELQAITNGAFTLTLGGVTNQVNCASFVGLTFTQIAAAIQTAIQAFTAAGTQWTAATVTYSATGTGSFNLQGGSDLAAGNVFVAPATVGSITDISSLLGWNNAYAQYPYGPVFSNGVQTETITQTLTNSATRSNNFGSFLFIPSLTQSQVVEASTWNNNQNNLYMFLAPVSYSDAITYATALQNLGGTALTLAPISTEYPEMIPGMILAATNYNLPNATQNYMFQQGFNVTPSLPNINDTNGYQAYDTAGVNYYGITQNASENPAFYQNGVLTGAATPTNATDMNTYANEQWLKNAITAALLTLLLNETQVSANAQGVAQVVTVILSIVNQATINGVISVNGFLDASQISAITQLTNDPDAWYQVQNTGYWLNAIIQPYTEGEYTFYRVVYTLVYKKNDAIRQIVGTDVLI